MATPEVVSIEVDRPRGAVRAWEDALSQQVGGVDPALRPQEATRCLPIDLQRFSGRIEHGVLGDMPLCRVAATANRFSRALTTRTPTLPTPALLVMISRGTCRLSQNGRASVLGAGDWSLIDTRYPHDYEMPSALTEGLALPFPRPTDAALGALFERGLARRWHSKAGLGRILRAMLIESFGELHRLSPSSGRKLSSAIVAMTWDALGEQTERPLHLSFRDSQRARVKAFIEAECADPELSVDTIAQACKMSVRNLHRLFADDPAGSVSRYVWQRRLAHCADTLRDPRQADRPITDICLSYGFNSTSHFDRLFKGRFGVTPRHYRAAS